MDNLDIDMLPMIKLARQLQEIVEAEQYDKIWILLDKISIPEGSKLGIELCKHEGTGSNSFVTYTFPDGKTIRDNADDSEFWNYLSFENSPMGAWQACLLKNLWRYLPMFWHALYSREEYKYEKEQLDDVYADPEMNESYKFVEISELFDKTKYDISPSIYVKGESSIGECYQISMCSWSFFGGLYRCHDDVFICNGKASFITWPGTCLYKYWCSIRF